VYGFGDGDPILEIGRVGASLTASCDRTIDAVRAEVEAVPEV
jgi:hypothetical protein